MNSILTAILFQINPLCLPIAAVLRALLINGLGPDTDPSYRAPQPTDDADIAFIIKYHQDGKPVDRLYQYRVCCKQLGADPDQPFHHSFTGV